MDRLRGSVKRFLDKLPKMNVKTDSLGRYLKADESVSKEARGVAEKRLLEGRLVMEDVWDLLIKGREWLPLSEEAVRKWQLAIEALLPYAINLYLAPNRPEFKHVKLFSSYYVHKIKGFIAAGVILHRMGYSRLQPDSSKLVLESCRAKEELLDTIAEMVTLLQQIELLCDLMHRAVSEGLSLGFLDFIRAAKLQRHSSLDDYWDAVKNHTLRQNASVAEAFQARNDFPPVMYETPSSAGLSSPERVHPDELPAPVMTQSELMAQLNGRPSNEYPNPFGDRGYGLLVSSFDHSITYDALRPESLPVSNSGSGGELCVGASFAAQCRSEGNLNAYGSASADGVVTTVDDHVENNPCRFVAGGGSGDNFLFDDDLMDRIKIPPSTHHPQSFESSLLQHQKFANKSQSIDERSGPRNLPPRVKSTSDLGAQVTRPYGHDVQSSHADQVAGIGSNSHDYHLVPSPRGNSPFNYKKGNNLPRIELKPNKEYTPSRSPHPASKTADADLRYAVGSPQSSVPWTCDFCQAKNSYPENECNKCGRLAYWVVCSPDSLGLTSNGHRSLPTNHVPHATPSPPSTTAASKATMSSSHTPTHWNCHNCKTQNSYIESICRGCHAEASWITAATKDTFSNQKLGPQVVADGSRRTQVDGPAAQRMHHHARPRECLDCMYLIPAGAEECPGCKRWINGSQKPERNFFNPLSWF